MSKTNHFEIGADDMKRAMTFYEKVFVGSTRDTRIKNYWLVTAGDKAEYGINGAIQPRTELDQSVINTITVESMDETIDRITNSGGKIVVPNAAIPNVGVLGVFPGHWGKLDRRHAGGPQPHDDVIFADIHRARGSCRMIFPGKP